ncbi:MAG: hypothetical protein M1826_007179 [Phylliscum demangeonii]|nr:MAG: hypothetical protein M1826_007179 [Phylliscum demangeonii]
MKLLGLVSVWNLVSVIALVAPSLSTPLRTPLLSSSSPSSVLKARSDHADPDPASHPLQVEVMGTALTADDVQRINKVDAGYQKYQRRAPGWLGWVQSGTRWAHEKVWQMQHPNKMPLSDANRIFVDCLKMEEHYHGSPPPPARLNDRPRPPVWPDGIQECDRVLHPSPQLRMMMKNAFYNEKKTVVQPQQAMKRLRGSSATYL